MAGGHWADAGDRGRLGHPAAGRLDYLDGYWSLILSEHGWALPATALTSLASVFAAIRWAARKAGLRDLGRKVEHIDRGLREGGAAEWGPGGSVR